MVFQTILKYLPMGDNMKVAFGTGAILLGSWITVKKEGAQNASLGKFRVQGRLSILLTRGCAVVAGRHFLRHHGGEARGDARKGGAGREGACGGSGGERIKLIVMYLDVGCVYVWLDPEPELAVARKTFPLPPRHPDPHD